MDYQNLYQETLQQLQLLTIQHQEFEETSTFLEQEQENTIKALQLQNNQVLNQLQIIKDEKIALQKELNLQISLFETKNQQFNQTTQQITHQIETFKRKIIEMENEHEILICRERQYKDIIDDKEHKLNNSIEQFVLLQTEFEMLKNVHQLEMNELRMNYRETTEDLIALKSQRNLKCNGIDCLKQNLTQIENDPGSLIQKLIEKIELQIKNQ